MILKYDPAVYINVEPRIRSLVAFAPTLSVYKKVECRCTHAGEDCVKIQTQTTTTLLSHFLSFCCDAAANSLCCLISVYYYFHIGR